MQSPSTSPSPPATSTTSNLTSSLKLKFKLVPKGIGESSTPQPVSPPLLTQSESIDPSSTRNPFSPTNPDSITQNSLSLTEVDSQTNNNQITSQKNETMTSTTIPPTPSKSQKGSENSLKIKIRWSSGSNSNTLPIPTNQRRLRDSVDETSSSIAGLFHSLFPLLFTPFSLLFRTLHTSSLRERVA
jgi:hypothetical protein